MASLRCTPAPQCQALATPHALRQILDGGRDHPWLLQVRLEVAPKGFDHLPARSCIAMIAQHVSVAEDGV